jgi:catechol 2,3-dioxygenase-like lactoylglutathione lyase family enzyme
VFSSPQTVLFCADVDASAAFYVRLGFTEAFRLPAEGRARHVDVVLDGHRVGLTQHDAVHQDHGYATNRDPRRAAVVLWCEDTPTAYDALLAAGATPMSEPHVFLDRLLIAWAADPDGHPIQVVQRR